MTEPLLYYFKRQSLKDPTTAFRRRNFQVDGLGRLWVADEWGSL